MSDDISALLVSDEVTFSRFILAAPIQLRNCVLTRLVRTPGGPMMVDEYGGVFKLPGNEIYAFEFVPIKFPVKLIVEAERVEGVSRGGGYTLPLMLLVVNC